jgi:hypothetical protein
MSIVCSIANRKEGHKAVGLHGPPTDLSEFDDLNRARLSACEDKGAHIVHLQPNIRPEPVCTENLIRID